MYKIDKLNELAKVVAAKRGPLRKRTSFLLISTPITSRRSSQFSPPV